MRTATTAQRLNQLMDEYNLKQVDILNRSQPFQKDTGITLGKSALSQYVSGKKEPDQRRLYLLAKTLNVNEAWLMGFDVSIDSVEGNVSTTPVPEPTVPLPYLGTVSAGGFEYPATFDESLLVPVHLIQDEASKYFILKVNGDSMNKEIANGHHVIVKDVRDGNYSPINGDILIFRSGSEYTMKKVRKTETMIHLEPDSYFDEFQTQSFPLDDFTDLEVVGKVIYSYKEY